MMNDKSTDELENELRERVKNEKGLNEYLDDLKHITFNDYLYNLMEEKNMKTKDIYMNCTFISDKYIYSIINGKKSNPSREIVIAIACGLGITVEQTNTLLKYAGHSKLYAKDKDDAIIMYCLEKKMSVDDIEELLRAKNSKYTLFKDRESKFE